MAYKNAVIASNSGSPDGTGRSCDGRRVTEVAPGQPRGMSIHHPGVDFETWGDLSARQTRRDGALLLDRIAAGTIILKIQGKSYRAHGQGREKENIQRNKKALATSSPHRRNFWAHLAATIHNWPLQSVTTTPVHI